MTTPLPVRVRPLPSEYPAPKKAQPRQLAPAAYPSVVDNHPFADKRKGTPSYDIDLMVRPVASLAGRVLRTDRILWSIDVETTGLNHYTDRIVQLAAVPYYPDGTRGPANVWFFDPIVTVSPEAEAIHHLSNARLRGQPTFEQAAAQIWELLKGGDLLGYNIKAFDVRMVANAFHRAGYAFPLPGTRIVDSLRIFWSNVTRDSAGGNHRLNTAHKFYCNTDIRDAHDAEADAQATLDVLLRQVAVHRDVPTHVADLHTYTQATRPHARADAYRHDKRPETPTLRPYTRAPLRISPDQPVAPALIAPPAFSAPARAAAQIELP